MPRVDARTVYVLLLLGVGAYLLAQFLGGHGPGGNVAMLVSLLYVGIGLLVAIDVHEFGHAITADALGDRTARMQGRVTLNPLAHLDPFGTMMLLMTFVGGIGIGWGKPVQINPSRVANGRWGMALISVAGVICNLVVAVLAAALLRLGVHGLVLGVIDLRALLQSIAVIDLVLAVFNFLVPLPPLDGFNFLVNVLPLRWSWQLRQLERFGPMLLLLLVLASQMRILLFNPLTYLVGVPVAWLSGALGLA